MANEGLLSAAEIQREMQSVRSSLRADVKVLVENARDMADWHYYVRRYPVACVAAAAATGFALTSLATPPAIHSEEAPSTSKGNGVDHQESPSNGASMTRQLLSHFSGIATSAISRAALSLLTQQISKIMDGHLPSPSQASSHEEAHSNVQSHR